MNTSKIKKFAQEARLKLITLVNGKLEAVLTQDTASLRGKADTINKLNQEIHDLGKEALIDKVAYTWFNRLVALRFMDANDFQPLGINILSPANGQNLGSPQILADIQAGIFPEDLKLDRDYINDLLNGKIASSNSDNDIYRHIVIAVCNDLHRIFPFLFERLDDYSELLLPDDLTSAFSIVIDIVDGMSVEDCTEVEIIGWLYQFYISEKKDEVFASKSKVKKEDIPAATQLFTPRWIVEYMVQNTVGKLWLQNNPNSTLKQYMPYYIESPKGNSEDYLKIDSVEEIKLLDQACGSGHILVYGFELLVKIYEEKGYSASDIPVQIIENNLYGLEIDERAAQLASFAITMKARQYYRRFFRKPATPNIICYEDIKLSTEEVESIITKYKFSNNDTFKYDLKLLEQATNLGSLIQPKTDLATLENLKKQIADEGESSDLFWQQTQDKLRSALQQLLPLAQKYHCVVDNPPYMGARKMEDALAIWLRANYINSYQDLSSCFIERTKKQLLPNGLAGFVTLQGWMFISSFETFRKWLLENYTFENLIQIGGNSFPSMNSQVARAVSFVYSNCINSNNSTVSFDLDSIDKSHNIDKQILFLDFKQGNNAVIRNFNEFLKVNRFTFLHSISSNLLNVFIDSIPMENLAKPRQGLATGSNERFVRYWFEVNLKKTYWQNDDGNEIKWYPYNKGGDFRKWYGNDENVVNWEDNGNAIKNFKDDKGKLRSRPQNEKFYFKNGITYSLIGNSDFCARKYGSGFLFDVGGSGFFADEEDELFLLGLVNSTVGSHLLSRLNPTVNFQVGDIGNIPIIENISPEIKQIIEKLSADNVEISKTEWNSYEENNGFVNDPLVQYHNVEMEKGIKELIIQRKKFVDQLFTNELFIDEEFSNLYKVDRISNREKKISLYGNVRINETKFDLTSYEKEWEAEIITNLISYAVGCMFGRYSLDKEGLTLANQGETIQDYLQKVGKAKNELRFVPDEDNVIPVLEEEWFDDDIVNRVKDFVRAIWGDASYQANIQHIEDTLGKDLRKYLTKDFYKDHVKRYKKRPIYWQFTSPKGHFNVMIYMHRYTPDTLNFILNSYLRPYMEKVNNDLKRQEDIIITGTAVEQGKARKRQDKLKDILKDCEAYEYDILFPLAGERIAIDLDDGVLVNYNKFGNTIASVAGLNDAKTKKKVREFDWIDTQTIR